MIQKIRTANTEMRFDCARLLISRTVNKQRHARLNQRARTHRARLDRRINRSVRQPVIPDFRRRFSQRNNPSQSGQAAGSLQSRRGVVLDNLFARLQGPHPVILGIVLHFSQLQRFHDRGHVHSETSP